MKANRLKTRIFLPLNSLFLLLAIDFNSRHLPVSFLLTFIKILVFELVLLIANLFAIAIVSSVSTIALNCTAKGNCSSKNT